MAKRRRAGSQSQKAITPAAITRAGGTVIDQTGQIEARRGAATVDQPAMLRALPRPSGWSASQFGPGVPLTPAAIDPLNPRTGRPEPRRYDYPVSWNLSGRGRMTSWATLREAAEIDLFRRCIEIRKDQLTGLDWDIIITPEAIETAERAEEQSGATSTGALGDGEAPTPGDSADDSPASASSAAGKPSRKAIETRLRSQYDTAIAKAKAFMRMPDRGNGLTTPQWLGQLLEEVFVCDAAAIYPRLTNGGDLYSLEVLDGSTIKPLLDERGGRPQPPYPAFQQNLWGFPRGEFTADVDDDGQIPAAYADGTADVDASAETDILCYFRRVARVRSPYGLSAVEQALTDGALYVKRFKWMFSEYDEGTTVQGLFEVDPTVPYSPENIQELEREFNETFSGQTGARHLARFLPPGIHPVDQGAMGSDAIAEKYRPEYDLHLIKLVISHFDTVLTELGFTDAGSGALGSTGYHEGMAETQFRKRRPIVTYIESIVSYLLHRFLDMPEELAFSFLGLDSEDDPSADEQDMQLQNAGVLTINERRDKMGLPRFDFPEADKAFYGTGRGIVFLEGASAMATPGQTIGPGAAPGSPPDPATGQPTTAPTPGAPAPAPKPPAAPATPPGKPATGVTSKLAEAGAYRKYLIRRRDGKVSDDREFRFEALTADEAAEVRATVPKARASVDATA